MTPITIILKVRGRVYNSYKFYEFSCGGVGIARAYSRNRVEPTHAIRIPNTSINFRFSRKNNTEKIMFNITVMELLLARNIWLPRDKAIVFRIEPTINTNNPRGQYGSKYTLLASFYARDFLL